MVNNLSDTHKNYIDDDDNDDDNDDNNDDDNDDDLVYFNLLLFVIVSFF